MPLHRLHLHAFCAAILIATLALVVGCAPASSSAPSAAPTRASGGSPVAAATTPAAASTAPAAVTMTDALKFEPATLTIAKGTTVTWRNTSSMAHTVTDDPSKAANKADAELPSGAEAWDSGNLNPGQTFQHTFDTPGTYKYFCMPHEAAGMVATITVTG